MEFDFMEWIEERPLEGTIYKELSTDVSTLNFDDYKQLKGSLVLKLWNKTEQIIKHFPVEITIPNSNLIKGEDLNLKVKSFSAKYEIGKWKLIAQIQVLGITYIY